MGFQTLWGSYGYAHNKCKNLNSSIMSTKMMMHNKPVLKAKLTTELHQVESKFLKQCSGKGF